MLCKLGLSYIHSTIKSVERKWNCPDLSREDTRWRFSTDLFLGMTDTPCSETCLTSYPDGRLARVICNFRNDGRRSMCLPDCICILIEDVSASASRVIHAGTSARLLTHKGSFLLWDGVTQARPPQKPLYPLECLRPLSKAPASPFP